MYRQLADQMSELCDRRADLEVELNELTSKIDNIGWTMTYLAPLAGISSTVSDIRNMGFTDAVRSVLDYQKRMSPAEIKQAMKDKHFDLSQYSAPDASIRTVLKRLVEAGKATEEKEGHNVFYKYQATDEEVPF